MDKVHNLEEALLRTLIRWVITHFLAITSHTKVRIDRFRYGVA